MSQARQHFARVVERHLTQNHPYSASEAAALCLTYPRLTAHWSGSQAPLRAMRAAQDIANLDQFSRVE